MNNDNCDCRATSSGFEFCRLHGAAPDMIEFVNKVANTLRDYVNHDPVDMSVFAELKIEADEIVETVL
jgi:hypothetical protein